MTQPSEAGPDAQTRDNVARVLDGHADYDDLTAPEQAVVRAEWAKRITDGLAGLNFARENT